MAKRKLMIFNRFLRRNGRSSICRTWKSKSKDEAAAAEESDDETPSGPDMEEVQRRMTNLKRQYNKTLKVIESKGRHSKEAKC